MKIFYLVDITALQKLGIFRESKFRASDLLCHSMMLTRLRVSALFHTSPTHLGVNLKKPLSDW